VSNIRFDGTSESFLVLLLLYGARVLLHLVFWRAPRAICLSIARVGDVPFNSKGPEMTFFNLEDLCSTNRFHVLHAHANQRIC
jgi:hypothetical protein